MPRREDQPRRLRAVPSPRPRGPPRPRRGGSGRSRSARGRPDLHQARRHDRLHGQRRWPGDDDDGPRQARRRRAGGLPRHRRWGAGREGRGGDAIDPRRPEGGRDPREHLRWHHPRRRGRSGPDRGPCPAGARRADGGPDRRHERRGGGGCPARGPIRDRGHARRGSSTGRGRVAGSRRVSILIDGTSRVVVHGLTGREGSFHGAAMLEYGTRVVAGMTPGKGGQTALDGRVPVFDTVADAVRETGADTSCIFVPAPGAPDAVMEAAGAAIRTIFCITEGIPALDMIPVVEKVRAAGARLIGPNCPGATSPGRSKVGIIPGSVHRGGRVGVVSRSGTLTYEAVQAMTDAGIGQSTCVGIGGDPVIGTTFLDVLQLFATDRDTAAIVLIGEIGGAAEEQAAAWAGEHLRDVPMAAFIAGRTAPEGKRMGHAGAIISGGSGTAASKVAALEAAGIRVAGSPTELPALLRDAGFRD